MKTYIGDGVYATCEDFDRIVLTVEDGITVTDTIYLEPDVCTALVRFMISTGIQLPSSPDGP